MSEGQAFAAAHWQQLYERLEKPLYNLAFRYVWVAQEAEDVVHDAFLQLWARRERIESATADRYLWTSVLNLARKRRRWARAKRFVLFEEWEQQSPGAHAADAAASQEADGARLRAAIEKLPEKLRTVLLLAEFSEMGYDEIAQLLAIPKGTVASRRHLAVLHLRERLGAPS
ncbi:MAG: RNA polymerase sigma factor [Steroidobacteraceae bacterium]